MAINASSPINNSSFRSSSTRQSTNKQVLTQVKPKQTPPIVGKNIDTVELSNAAKGSLTPTLGSTNFSVDSGYDTAEIDKDATPLMKEFIEFMLSKEEGVEPMYIPNELHRAGETIQGILGHQGVEGLRPYMLRSNIPTTFGAFIANFKDPKKVLDQMDGMFDSSEKREIVEQGIRKNVPLQKTGYQLLAEKLPAKTEWTGETLKAFMVKYVHLLMQSRINLWVDTMNMQDFEAEVYLVTEQYKSIHDKKVKELVGFNWDLLTGSPKQHEVAKKSIAGSELSVQKALDDYKEISEDLKLKAPSASALHNIKKLTREKILEPLFTDMVKRVVYGDEDLNQHLVFTGSKLCDSMGVDVYIADPTHKQRYIAADLTTSAMGYHKKIDLHKSFERNGNDYLYDNFATYCNNVEKFSDDITIAPYDKDGKAFQFDTSKVQKQVIYLDPTLWLPLLDYAIHAIKTQSYELGSGHLNTAGIESAFTLERSTVRGNRAWKKYSNFKAYLQDLIQFPEKFAPPNLV